MGVHIYGLLLRIRSVPAIGTNSDHRLAIGPTTPTPTTIHIVVLSSGWLFC